MVSISVESKSDVSLEHDQSVSSIVMDDNTKINESPSVESRPVSPNSYYSRAESEKRLDRSHRNAEFNRESQAVKNQRTLCLIFLAIIGFLVIGILEYLNWENIDKLVDAQQ